MKFVDRTREIKRMEKALGAAHPQLVVVYGRRRVGKSTLIRKVLHEGEDVYFQADETQTANQLYLLAKAVAGHFPGFDHLQYPDWYSLLEALNFRATKKFTLCLDEFPYLVKSFPALPSVIQRFWDTGSPRFNLILCGSSQQSMYSDILNEQSPLYGRSDCTIKLQPISISFIGEAMGLATVEEFFVQYSLWGGIPRYWQLSEREGKLEDAVRNLILMPDGSLADEPSRLLRDDLRDLVLSRTLLSVIGSGVNRLSEIAARLGRKATELTSPLRRLIDMGYVEREVPFGESQKGGKRSVYKICDQFMNSYYRFVAPAASMIAMGHDDRVWNRIERDLTVHVGTEWERQCRRSLSGSEIDGVVFGQASRWWGTAFDVDTKKGRQMEFDLMAQSEDKAHLLVGECKWASADYASRLLDELKEKTSLLPFAKDYRQIHYVLCLREKPLDPCHATVLLPADIIRLAR